MHWQGETIRFPRVLDIPAPDVIREAFFGPEDPRVIIEDYPDAEPVIIFNMLYDTKNLYRAMFIMQPFSNDTTMLRIAGGDPEQAEKNWMPFMYREQPARNAFTGLDMSDQHEWPTHHLHFIYNFKPLRMLKCHLLTGWCDWAYQQKAPDSPKRLPEETSRVLRGSTNLVAFRSQNEVRTFVGFPKSNVRVDCGEAFYRSSILVFTAASQNPFHVDYMSDSVEFGDQVLTSTARSDPCVEGRIMMANSIAKLDRSAGKDLMTITCTVDDVTTQNLRMHGMEAFVDSIRLPWQTWSQ